MPRHDPIISSTSDMGAIAYIAGKLQGSKYENPYKILTPEGSEWHKAWMAECDESIAWNLDRMKAITYARQLKGKKA